ncbi:hypothetical protein HUG10_21580 (plasmid) [Halorarum halophilum]|uniref:Uncharacterized protein n=1 Tax=Halorarum halophilum TaxID=2743090 RepID=A0A7D5KQD7_9EURY|nr:hypothetical protein [Halobaculum halophilum]QLG30182.1 hypothetical protein HUG10_21580 [Halobaculum halophilum]
MALLFPIRSGGGGERTPIKIGPTYLDGVVGVSERGGMNAPTKRTEVGYSYTSKVRAEPVSVSIEAYVEPTTYGQLTDLRDADRPVPVTVGFVSLGASKVDDIRVEQTATRTSHYKVTIDVTQVHEAKSGTATLVIDASSGDSGSGSTHAGSAALKEPTLVRSQDKATSGGPGGDHPKTDQVMSWLGF